MKVILAGAFGNLGAEILKCLCRDGHEVVITTMGLTGASTRFTSYDIDYKGNLSFK